MDETFQELCTLQWIWILSYFSLHNYAQRKSKKFLVQDPFHSYKTYNAFTYLANVKVGMIYVIYVFR